MTGVAQVFVMCVCTCRAWPACCYPARDYNNAASLKDENSSGTRVGGRSSGSSLLGAMGRINTVCLSVHPPCAATVTTDAASPSFLAGPDVGLPSTAVAAFSTAATVWHWAAATYAAAAASGTATAASGAAAADSQRTCFSGQDAA